MPRETQVRSAARGYPPVPFRGHDDVWPANYVEVNRGSYDALADEYRGRKESDREKDKRLIQPFLRLLRQRFDGKQIRVMDVGCGAGLNLEMFAAEGLGVVGIDVSAKMLEVARERCLSAELIQGDILALQLSSHSFQGAFAKAIIHLFTKPDALCILKKIHSLLETGGIFYVTSTVEAEYSSGLRPKADYRGAPSRYRRVWADDELAAAVLSCGFRILETSYNVEEDRSKKWFNIWAEKV